MGRNIENWRNTDNGKKKENWKKYRERAEI